MRVAAIVPAYNEARSLPRLAEALRAHAPACDVCVVDDGSTDETARVAASLGWTVLRLAVNLGIGGARRRCARTRRRATSAWWTTAARTRRPASPPRSAGPSSGSR